MAASNDDIVHQEQGFLSHLIELRDRLMRMLLSVGVLFLGLFWLREPIYTWLADPLLRFLPEGSQMIATGVAAPFLTPVKLVLMLSVFIAVPYLLYQIWAFVAPGLYTHEKRLVAPLLLSSTLLFYCGVAFAYYVVFPLVFKFFIAVAPEGVQATPDIASYLDFVISIFFAFGIAFEVPVVTVLIVAVGITTPEQLKKIRAYVFVGAFVVGMFLTPPDVISQTLLAVPIWLLYEVGIVFSSMFKQRIREAGDAIDSRQDSSTPGSGDAARDALPAPDDGSNDPGANAEADDAAPPPAARTPEVKGGFRNSLTDHGEETDGP